MNPIAQNLKDVRAAIAAAAQRARRDPGSVRLVAEKAPLDRVLVETDCPYLPPQPWRGQRNEPAYVVATAQQLADIRGLRLEEVAAHTWANTLRPSVWRRKLCWRRIRGPASEPRRPKP